MLGDIDLSIKPNKPEIYLCKPNKAIIAKLNESFDVSFKPKMGNLSELTFSIPYKVMIKHRFVDNPNMKKLKDRYLIKFVLGNYVEYFFINEPQVNVENDKNYKTVTCYSLSYELKGNVFNSYETYSLLEDGTKIEQSMSADAVLEQILQGTLWSVGYVDSKFMTKYRTFKEGNTTSLDMINKIMASYICVAVYDTVNRTVSLWDADRIGNNKGFRLTNGQYTKKFQNTNKHDDFCTVLRVFGKDGMSIESVNPTGQDYIEDLSFYMRGYAEDESGNVISHSDSGMSDGLCHAISEYNKKLQIKKNDFSTLLNTLSTKNDLMDQYLTQRDNLNTQLKAKTDQINISLAAGQSTGVLSPKRDDITARINKLNSEIATETNNALKTSLISERDGLQVDLTAINTKIANYDSLVSQKNSLQTQITANQVQIDSLQAEIDGVYANIATLRQELSYETNFTTEQIAEKKIYSQWEKILNDNNSTTPSDLYEFALEQMEKFKYPQVVASVDIVNFLAVQSEQKNWDKLNIGDIVTLYYPEYGCDIEAKIIEAEFKFESDEITITISNFKDIMDNMDKFVSDLAKSVGAATTLEISKDMWDGVQETKGKVEEILSSNWNAIKNAIIAGTNESVIIDANGITIKSSIDPNRFIRMNHECFGISIDGGNTYHQAITGDGIYAEQLIGRVILGEDLIIGDKDGLLEFRGNKGIITDHNDHLVMKFGLYDTVDGVDKFGLMLINGRNRVIIDKDDGFKIQRLDESGNWIDITWLNEVGDLHLENIIASGNINATSFSLNGVPVLTEDGQNIDGQHVKHLQVDYLDSGTINANVVHIRASFANGGFIQIDQNGFLANDGTKDTVKIDAADGKAYFSGEILSDAVIQGATFRTAPEGERRIEIADNSFKTYNSNDNLNGLCLEPHTVDGVESLDSKYYHDGNLLFEIYDNTDNYILRPAGTADILGFGADDKTVEIHGSCEYVTGGNTKLSIKPSSTAPNAYFEIEFGQGTGVGQNGRAVQYKDSTGLTIKYTDSNGIEKTFTANDNGIGMNTASGSYIQIDNSGNINIHAANNVNITSGGNVNIN